MNISLSNIEVRLPGRGDPLFTLPGLQVEAGSRVLIHGPSGRGKTTLMNLMSGQLLPHAGTVRVGSADLTALDQRDRAHFRRAHFGQLFQRRNLVDHLTVLENILLGLSRRGAEYRMNRAREALDKVLLSPLADRQARFLSPGEMQRVAVARIWAGEPDVMFADEPTSSLDGAGADLVMDILWRASEGRTMVVVSHDPRIRGRFADARDFMDLIS